MDLRVLGFVTRLFVHIPPNNTGWCKTIEEFLDSQGYKVTTKVSLFIDYYVTLLNGVQDTLCRRFSGALQWYNALQDATNKHVDNVLTHVQRIMVGIDDGLLEDATSDSNFLTPPTSPTPMWMAPIAISSPGQCTTDEAHDHEFLFHSRAPSVILLESQTRSPETFSTLLSPT